MLPVPDPDIGGVDAAAFVRLQAEVTDLRLRLGEEVRSRRVVVVDETGIARIRLTADEGQCRIVLLDADGFERIALTAKPETGTLTIATRPRSDDPTRIDVFALDADEEDPDDVPAVGVELIDTGNSIAGLTLYEGRRPTFWTDPV